MKQNKKGFTLAELLIVIAIIAILIAIAIPAFGGALNNAKIQTDHANMRSAYAMAQSATLQGVLYTGKTNAFGLDEAIDVSTIVSSEKYYFMQDGTLQKSDTPPADAYRLKANATSFFGSSDPCAASIPCKNALGTRLHNVNWYIYLTAFNGKVTVNIAAS